MADPMKLLGVEPFAPFWSWFKWIEGISNCFFVMAGHSNDNVSEGCKLGFEHGVCLSCSASGCMVEPYNRRPGHWSSSPHRSDTCCQCLTVHSEKHNWGPHLGTAGMYTQSLIPPSNYWYLKFSEEFCAQEFFQASLVSKFHLGWGLGWHIAGTETPDCVLSFWRKWCRRAEKPSYCWGPALSFPCLILIFSLCFTQVLQLFQALESSFQMFKLHKQQASWEPVPDQVSYPVSWRLIGRPAWSWLFSFYRFFALFWAA